MTDQPLRGDAAYRAQRDAIAKRNDAAQARGAAQRAAKQDEANKRDRDAARLEQSILPEQPRP